MKRTTIMQFCAVGLVLFVCGFITSGMMSQRELRITDIHATPDNSGEKAAPVKLGAFSMSLSVKDLDASIQFYKTLGFELFGGAAPKNYVIMKNGNALIGLFHGMFQGNALTFNPGWDENAKPFEPFDDVRSIQKRMKNAQYTLTVTADEKTTGPAYFMTKDPDGNVILVDQHR